MKILSAASSHPERNPKPPSRTEIDALSCRGDSGGLPQDGNGKHGVLRVWDLLDLDGMVRLQGIAFLPLMDDLDAGYAYKHEKF